MTAAELRKANTEEKIKRTIAALDRHNIDAYYAETLEDVSKLAMSFVEPGSSISCGGSETLKECGILEKLRSGEYNFLDRRAEGLSREQSEELERSAFFADVYFTSSNAITENGELYNVDGNANRVAAICYGPKKVIVIAGANKLVRDLDEAALRVKSIAAPCNTQRLNMDTPCQKLGECAGIGRRMTDGCIGAQRICCQYLVTGYQRKRGRIHVILTAETLGY